MARWLLLREREARCLPRSSRAYYMIPLRTSFNENHQTLSRHRIAHHALAALLSVGDNARDAVAVLERLMPGVNAGVNDGDSHARAGETFIAGHGITRFIRAGRGCDVAEGPDFFI